MPLSEELLKLRASDPDLAQVLDTFARVDAIYQEALRAGGVLPEQSLRVESSANVTVSVDPSAPGVGPTNR